MTKTELERCRTSATTLKWVRAVALAVLILAVLLILSGCFAATVDSAGNVTASFSYGGNLPVKGFAK